MQIPFVVFNLHLAKFVHFLNNKVMVDKALLHLRPTAIDCLNRACGLSLAQVAL